MKKSRLDGALKILLWFCILLAIAGLVIQAFGLDAGGFMVMAACGIGVFPAFHFASLVAFRSEESSEQEKPPDQSRDS